MSYRARQLIRDRQRSGQGWVRAMWFMLGIDIIEAEQASALCEEMVSIYQQTDGEFGWPNCSHL
mgnify:CR=1 FL=1